LDPENCDCRVCGCSDTGNPCTFNQCGLTGPPYWVYACITHNRDPGYQCAQHNGDVFAGHGCSTDSTCDGAGSCVLHHYTLCVNLQGGQTNCQCFGTDHGGGNWQYDCLELNSGESCGCSPNNCPPNTNPPNCNQAPNACQVSQSQCKSHYCQLTYN
jgi:hypothetical protein